MRIWRGRLWGLSEDNYGETTVRASRTGIVDIMRYDSIDCNIMIHRNQPIQKKSELYYYI